MKRILSLLLLAAMLLGLAACGASQPADTGTPADTSTTDTANTGDTSTDGTGTAPETPAADVAPIVWGMSTLWNSLQPFNNTNYYNSIIISMLYDQLVYVEVDGTISPRGAKSWSQSEDGRTITFQLDENATFHDGTKVTAADWVWSLQLLSKAGVGFADQSLLAVIDGTDDAGVELSENSLAVQADGDYTLSITFKQAANMESFLMSSSYFMVVLPSHLLKDIPADAVATDAFWTAPVGSGPCKFVSQSADGTELTLARYEGYHLGNANWNTMIFRQVDAGSLSSAMLTGEIDIAYAPIPNDEALSMDGAAGITLNMRDEATQTYVIALNNQVVTDVRVREAINKAIDKTRLCTLLTGSAPVALADPMELYIPASNPYYPTDLAAAYDVEGAKALLEEAKADGYDGKFVLAAPAAGQRADLAVLIGEDLTAAGFEVELVTIDAATMMSDLKSGADGQYDGGIIIYGITPDPMCRNDILSASSRTVLSLTDETYEQKQAAINAELDADARKTLIEDYYAYLNEQMPAVWLCGKKQYYVYSSRLGNVTDDLIEIARRNVPVWLWEVN